MLATATGGGAGIDGIAPMPRQLLILRHAKSAWDTGAATDFERPLARRGKRDARRVGRRLRKRDLIPDHVFSSPAARARQTTLAVCEVLSVKKRRIHWDRRIYGGDLEALLAVLGECPRKAATVLLVGHNPGLEELVAYLCGRRLETPADGKLLPTATVAQLRLPKRWKKLRAGTARVLAITRPGR